MENGKISPAIFRFSLGWLSLLASVFCGYFELWKYFGLTLGLSFVLFLGAYLENYYRRIVLRFDRLEELLRNRTSN